MTNQTSEKLIDLSRSKTGPFLKVVTTCFKWPINAFLRINRINKVYQEEISQTDSSNVFPQVLKSFGVSYNSVDSEISQIPETGPLMMVANHPFGGVDGVLLVDMLLKQRKDVKILANEMLHSIPQMQDRIIPVDVFTPNSKMANGRAMLKAIDWVKGGGALIIFPAGAVAHFQWKKMKFDETPWSAHIGAMIRKSQATILPVHVKGRNSFVYQALGSFSAFFRSLMLGREMLNKNKEEIKVMIGQAIPWKKLEGFESDAALTDYLKDTVAFMRKKDEGPKAPQLANFDVEMEEIIPAVDSELLAIEVDNLPASAHLIQRKELSVYVAEGQAMPHVMRELGRLREIAYRDVEEGSGLSCDVDTFDGYYLQLFVWNHEKQEVVGAYRLGLVDQILREHGKKGLYTHTLFKYKKNFINYIENSIELGRSFIRPEYREAFGILPLMWKGICLFMVRNPQYRKLFGGVSISNGYKNRSRNLMVRFLQTHNCDPMLSHYVKARTPYKTKKCHKSIKQLVKSTARDMDDVSMAISSVEKDNKGIPVLVKHYLKLQAQFLSFNLDREFSDVVDGLILLDMDHSSERMIRHYMGPENYENYMAV